MISRGPSVTRLATFVNGNAYKPENFGPDGFPVVRIRQLLDASAEIQTAPVPANPVWLEDGDLVFSWSATLAVRFWTRGKALLNQHLFRVDCRPGIERRWFAYVLEEGVRRLEPLMHGSTMTHITADMLKTLTIAVPPLATQRGIADYLDRHMERMDRLLASQRALVALLNERIDATVKGHVASSPLGGGNVLPAEPLKRLLRKVSRRFPDGAPVVTAYRDGEVNARANRREDGYTLASGDSTYQGVLSGDVVLHGLDGFAGAIGTARADGSCSPVYHVCEAIPPNVGPYMARLLRVLALDGYLGLHATSVRERAVDLRNWELVGSIRVPVAPSDAQVAVARLIDAAMPITAASMRIARLLQERREAVITAAVTGQLDIPEAA